MIVSNITTYVILFVSVMGRKEGMLVYVVAFAVDRGPSVGRTGGVLVSE